MFTVEAIKTAHSKIKSGADFPNYVTALKLLGVLNYETFVVDGHTNYKGANGYSVNSQPIYGTLDISMDVNKEKFEADLKKHQRGGSSYLEFCKDCASSGVNKWIVDTNEMNCTYYNLENKLIYTEPIPA